MQPWNKQLQTLSFNNLSKVVKIMMYEMLIRDYHLQIKWLKKQQRLTTNSTQLDSVPLQFIPALRALDGTFQVQLLSPRNVDLIQ